YTSRRPLVVDSSLVAAFLFGEPRCEEALARMEGWALCAPRIIDFEVANIGMNKIRSKQTTLETAKVAMNAFREMSIEISDIEPDVMLEMAARLGLSAYDAAYICLAEAIGAPLVTFDEALGRAAVAHFAKGTP
ncbi:MAG: type II toxin-antitoxin system VapC family toxin, partial [Betaproteobacteria bacterium]|nr:type II toxin-antitoxin system VapC family toxin [Betaproteobacteria bacterium]